MTVIEATYRIVTPMFCSGADQQTAELRLASFKGVLRFWWRSLMWGKVLVEAQGDRDKAVDRLRSCERELFGSCESGQARVRMQLRWTESAPDDSELVRQWPGNRPAVGSTYLGYGITESGRRNSRDYKPHRVGLPCGRSFKVSFAMRKLSEPVNTDSLTRALQLLGLVGGMGSRSRRAFGSLAITQLNGQQINLSSSDDYRCMVAHLAGHAPDELPPYSAFSRHTRIALLPGRTAPFQAHEELGETFRNFRGQPGPYRGRAKVPLGLPLKDVDDRRRASPLIMHIHPIADQFVPVVLFQPSLFHPEIPEGNNIEFYELITSWLTELNGESL